MVFSHGPLKETVISIIFVPIGDRHGLQISDCQTEIETDHRFAP